MMIIMDKVLVTGSTGYIGGRLIPHLLSQGEKVVCLVRLKSSIDRPFSKDVAVVNGSADNVDEVANAAQGCKIAYYLIHSLGSENFEERDRLMAEAFRKGCEAANVERIVYLGGLGDENDDLSEHLKSRQETGKVLASGNIAVTELRAAIIIGSGSASFEMLRSLTEVLPIMTTPSWVNKTRCQPTAVDDVMDALLAARHRTENGHDVLELGGPDVVTYREMMEIYAEVAELPERKILGLPVLTPRLSSYWVSLVTPLPNTLAKQLVGSLVNDVVVTQHSAADALNLKPLGFRQAVQKALAMVEDLEIPTSWSGNASSDLDATPDVDDPDWSGGKVFEDMRVAKTTEATAEEIFDIISSLGGKRGWLSGNIFWRIRGGIDKIIGGSGLRRGRRHPTDLKVGDVVDFWRVVRLEPNEHLRLLAEMRLPGFAWLEWQIDTDNHSGRSVVTLTQRARFVPKGLFGRIYWFSLAPFHQFIFPGLASKIITRAESHDSGS